MKKIKRIIWFWKTSFEYLRPKSKLWVFMHGFKPFMTFLRLEREERASIARYCKNDEKVLEEAFNAVEDIKNSTEP